MFKLKTALLALLVLACVVPTKCAGEIGLAKSDLASFGQFLVNHQLTRQELKTHVNNLLKTILSQVMKDVNRPYTPEFIILAMLMPEVEKIDKQGKQLAQHVRDLIPYKNMQTLAQRLPFLNLIASQIKY